MSRTRWKLMIGSLGLGLGGLAAIADTPDKPGISCAPAPSYTAAKPPTPTQKMEMPQSAMELPAAPALPKVEPITPTMPPLPIPPLPPMKGEAKPFVVPLPAIGDCPTVADRHELDAMADPGVKGVPKPLALPLPPPPSDEQKPLALPTLPITSNSPPAIPEMPALKPEAPAVPTIPAQSADVIPFPASANSIRPLFPLSEPGVTVREMQVDLKNGTVTSAGPPLGTPPAVVLNQRDFELTAATPATPNPALSEVKPVAVSVTPAPSRSEKKLQVLLHMGDERPKFEVRDGEVVYLRVTSEKVDVKSPTDSIEANLSTMRATGKVRFVTPGGEGTCDELSVVPGSGQVTVMGHVAFIYSWGKVETTVTGEKMTFRLGDAPAGSR